MLLNLRSRRRLRYGAFICAASSAVLLLLSVSLLYSRLSHSNAHLHSFLHPHPTTPSLSDYSHFLSTSDDDPIDALDFIQANPTSQDDDDDDPPSHHKIKNNGLFFDHVSGFIRKAFTKRSFDDWDVGGDKVGIFMRSHGVAKRSIDEWNKGGDKVGIFMGSDDVAVGKRWLDGWEGVGEKGGILMGDVAVEDRSRGAFGSDDVAVDEGVRGRGMEVRGIEDLLMLKVGRRVSPLREGWGEWFEKKGDFLKKDKMLKSTLEVLNPLRNPLLQDPDGAGVSGFTRGDRIVQRYWLNEFKKSPFPLKKNTFDASLVSHGSA